MTDTKSKTTKMTESKTTGPKMTGILLFAALFLFSGSTKITASKMTDLKMTEMTGIASYYSTTGCLGCSSTLTMANGEKLDDSKMTVALSPETVRKYKLLNKPVGIINPKNHKWIIAKMTDTGGFTKYNRIADLSLESKKQLECDSLCQVIIIF